MPLEGTGAVEYDLGFRIEVNCPTAGQDQFARAKNVAQLLAHAVGVNLLRLLAGETQNQRVVSGMPFPRPGQ